jgi:hypothetical protein
VSARRAGKSTSYLAGCAGYGRDGKFVKPTEFGVTCDVDYPGFLAFEGGPAPIATVDTVSCVPLVRREWTEGDLTNVSSGCGFEQPLEAALKALAPHNSEISFTHGEGHGDRENAGFLRDNSLLVVVVVTDEDDCSTTDYGIFDPQNEQNRQNGINVACHLSEDKLFDVERYVDSLKNLRPDNDNVIFTVIAGVQKEMTQEDYRAQYDLTTDAGAKMYYDDMLASDVLQVHTTEFAPMQQRIAPSCTTAGSSGPSLEATPPRRLLEVAKGFGARSVVGSLCDSEFGSTAGNLIRAIGEQLAAAGND